MNLRNRQSRTFITVMQVALLQGSSQWKGVREELLLVVAGNNAGVILKCNINEDILNR
jgi:hypothetical protein